MGSAGVQHAGEGPDDLGRRRFLTASTAVVGAVGVVAAAIPFIESLSPSEAARAAGAPVNADISALEVGQRLILEWRLQPIWVVHRSPQTLAVLPSLDDRLRDPKSQVASQQPPYCVNEWRSIKPEISVLVGVCTHLGCSPDMYEQIRPEPFDPNWKGGYFCPCHKSRFDMAGRVFDGVPAPINLLVPPYHFASDTLIVVGVNPNGEA